MSELSKFTTGGVPASTADLIQGLQNVNALIKSSSGVPFLRLLKSGNYAYGPENIEPESGSEWAVNPYSIMHGFACWVDSELMGETMVPFNQPMPSLVDLPDYGGDWDQQVAVTLQCMTGEDEGTSVMFKGTSTGLRTAIKNLIAEIVNQASVNGVLIVPVITLEADSYQHKKYGEIFYPELEVKNWMTMEGVSPEEPKKTDGEKNDEWEVEIKEKIEVTGKKEKASDEPRERKSTVRRRRRG